MKTAALVVTTGDPLLARYWVNNYQRTWRGEVDELRVLVNGNAEGAAVYRDAGAIVAAMPQIGHGQALDILVRECDADAAVLIEDDAFVRHPGAIRSRIDRILRGDDEVIGCPRGGMSPELHAAARDRWGPDPEGPDTSSGYGLWPCFLFLRPGDVRALPDPRWESIGWGQGERVPGIEYVGNSVTTDTATIVAYQLRERHRITLDVNYKEMWQKDFAAMSARTGEPPYFHAGGMSCNEAQHARPDIGMDNNEGRDWAHRFWWWRRVGHDYREHYERAGLDPDYWTPIVEPWINWEGG